MIFNEIGIINQLATALFEARLPDGILMSHFAIINHLIRVRDGATPLELARAFQVPKTTMTHSLTILTRHGLIEMRPNPKDARSKQVWLTQAGRQFQGDAIAALAPELMKMAGDLPDTAAALKEPLRDLRIYMDKARD